MALLQPAAAGTSWTGADYVDYNSQSTSKFIPSYWSSKLVEKTYPAVVMADIMNVEYEGEIRSMGDSVIIRQSPNMNTESYQPGQELDYQTPEMANLLLEINRAITWQAALDDIHKYQSDLDLLSDFMQDASYRVAIDIDRELLAEVPMEAGDGSEFAVSGGANTVGANFGNTAGFISQNITLGAAGAPFALTKDNVVDYIVWMGLVLDERNVPRDGNRNLVIPNWMAALVKRADLKDASLAGDAVSISRNGLIGSIDSFNIYRSNLLNGNTSVGHDIIASHRSASTFAMQIDNSKTVHMPNPKTHGELIRGLTVFGYKTLKPDHLAWGVVVPG